MNHTKRVFILICSLFLVLGSEIMPRSLLIVFLFAAFAVTPVQANSASGPLKQYDSRMQMISQASVD